MKQPEPHNEEFPTGVSLLKRMKSYFMPVLISHAYDVYGSPLKIYLYKNQWQLAKGDALYSDGVRYLPFRLAFKEIGKYTLSKKDNILLLGTGLASGVQIFSKKYNREAHFTLVEIDRQILNWATALLTVMGIKNISAYCRDAHTFLNENEVKFDLVLIDIFIGRHVPELFTSASFLKAVKTHLSPGGIWIMNYMINSDEDLVNYKNNLKSVFKDIHMIYERENIIFWGSC